MLKTDNIEISNKYYSGCLAFTAIIINKNFSYQIVINIPLEILITITGRLSNKNNLIFGQFIIIENLNLFRLLLVQLMQ